MSKTTTPKRLLALMLCLCMVLGMAPAAALATEEPASGYAVDIGGTVTIYTDFWEAVDAACAAEAATLSLYQDVIAGLYTLTGGNVTLDLNGKTVNGRLTVKECTLTVTDTAETKGTVVNYVGAALTYNSGKLIILDTTDFLGVGEGHKPWRINRGVDAAADAGTIGTTGTEDIVLPADYMAINIKTNAPTTLLPETGNTILIHRHTWADATCTAPKACTGCKATEGEPVPENHEWADATCTAPKTCTGCGATEGEPALENHSWADATCSDPKTCTVCGAVEGEALGHSFGEDGICAICGGDKYSITINMTDSFGDGWNGNAIAVYEDSVLVATATVESGSTATWTHKYDPEKQYSFCWVMGSFAVECSFEIVIGGEVVFEASTVDCDKFIDGYLLYTVCNHSFDEDGKCTSCGMMAAYAVNIGGAVTIYTDFWEAVDAACAAEAATLTLYQDVTAGFYMFTGGNVTLDLNGKTVNGRLAVKECTLTVTDTAETKGTVVNYSGSAVDYCSGKLIILDTTDCLGNNEGHEPWKIGREFAAAADVGTIGTNGTEDIVIPAGCVAIHALTDDPMTFLPPTGYCVVIHRHTWVDATCTAPKTCTGCGAVEGEALGHSFGEDGICAICGTDKYSITINMTDSFGDGWNGNAIAVYEDSVLVATATVESGSTATWTGKYDPEKKYRFYWVKDSYYNECSFEIVIGGEVVFEASTDDCTDYADGYLFYPVCDHNYVVDRVVEPTCTEEGYTVYECSLCGDSYEGDFKDLTDHSLDEDGKCTVCGIVAAYTVNIGGTVTIYTDFYEAVDAACAAEAATLTLYQDVTAGVYTFTGGNVTLDLNGKTVNGRLTVNECTLTVTDTAETKGTVVNYCGCALVYTSGKLIILDTADFCGNGEGHAVWNIMRTTQTAADAGTIGTTGTEDIVLPADCVAIDNQTNAPTTLLPQAGYCVGIHRHTWADATCTDPKTCTGCGAVEGEALGHSFGEDGICLNCGAYKNSITINMTDSNGDSWSGNAIAIYEDGVPVATVTVESGRTATWTGKYDPEKQYSFFWVKGTYSDECFFEIVIDGEVVFEASAAECSGYTNGQRFYPECDHDHTVTVVDPTCTEDGYTAYDCPLCGNSYKTDWKEELGHSFDGDICTVCGYDLKDVITINMTDSYGDGWNDNALAFYVDGVLVDTVTIDDGFSASWTYEYDSDKEYEFYWVMGRFPEECAFEILICGEVVFEAADSYCGSYPNGYRVFPACEHVPEKGEVTPPTCFYDGYTTYTCTVCGLSYRDDIVKAPGHHTKSAEEAVVKLPTCTDWGYTTYTCTVCGEVFDDDHVDALGHVRGEDGNCTVCGELYSVAVWVADVQITAENMEDILGDGTASFDDTTDTLTLNGFNLICEDGGIYSAIPLNIVLVGENTITTNCIGIEYDVLDGAINISGTGSLTINSYDEGIYVLAWGNADLVIGGSVTINVNSENEEGIYLEGNTADLLITDNAKLTIGTEDAPINNECIYVEGYTRGSATISGNADVHLENTDEEGIYVIGDQESITIAGGSVYINAEEEGLDAGTITITGGTIEAYTFDDNYEGIFTDDLTITGGTITVGGAAQGIEAENITITGGILTVVEGGLIAVGDDGLPGTITLTGVQIVEPQGATIGAMELDDEGTVKTVLNADGTYADTLVIKAGCGHTDEDDSGRCDLCDCLMQPARLKMASISMNGNIAINYYMLLSDEVLSDETAYMQFTMADGEIIKIPVSQGIKADYNGETYYAFSCAVNAKEMTDDVVCQFFYEVGSTEPFTYSVQTYANNILEKSRNEDMKALVKAMLHYGAASQTHFGYRTDDLANADLEAPDYSGVTINGFAPTLGQGTQNVKLYSASLILKSETTLRFFFNGEIAATYNGAALEVKQRSGLYYVDVVGIAAKDLDEDVTITINDGTVTAEISFNPMAYCQGVQNDTTGAFDAEMKDLVRALYLYNQAANVYFKEV